MAAAPASAALAKISKQTAANYKKEIVTGVSRSSGRPLSEVELADRRAAYAHYSNTEIKRDELAHLLNSH